MKISIAMTTYNGAEYIQQELDSILRQTMLPDELVVCDDGSTDSTVSILDAFEAVAPFDMKVVCNERNLGYTKNFEKSLLLTSGDVIFLADQDDIWKKEKISSVVAAFDRHPEIDVIIHDGALVDEGLVSYGATKLQQVRKGYVDDSSFITGALTALRARFLSICLPIPEGITGHDGWIHALARMLGKRHILETDLQKLRRHSSNTSGWVASNIKPINKATVLRSQFASTPSESYEDRDIYNIELTRRMQKILETSDDAVLASLVMNNLDYLKSERLAIRSREALIAEDFVHRKLTAIRMLLSGEYAYFNGFKSFVRDFMR